MLDNTITPTTNTLTPEQLREALDRWAEEQPGVFKKNESSGGFNIKARLIIPDQAENNSPQECNFLVATGGSAIRTLLSRGAIDRLTLLAIEHRYLPWLRLVATLPYTGAKAARLALGAWNESVEEPEEKTLKEVLEINDGLTTEDSQARVGAVKPLNQVIAQVRQDLGDRVSVEGGECNE